MGSGSRVSPRTRLGEERQSVAVGDLRVGATTAIDAASSPLYGRVRPTVSVPASGDEAAWSARGAARRAGWQCGRAVSSRTMARRVPAVLVVGKPPPRPLVDASAAHGGGGLILSPSPRETCTFVVLGSPWSGTRSLAFPTTGPSQTPRTYEGGGACQLAASETPGARGDHRRAHFTTERSAQHVASARRRSSRAARSKSLGG